MTTSEQHAEIGRMYVEREDARRRLACIENRMRRMKAALEASVRALDGDPWDSRSEHPDADAIASVLRDRKQTLHRLNELQKFFDGQFAVDTQVIDLCLGRFPVFQ